MKNLTKIMSVLLIAVMLISVSSTVLAATTASPTPGDMTGANVPGMEDLTNVGNQIVTILTTIGIIASVIILIVLGIKYMMGSAEEKAEYKKTMMPYVIGAALVFAASAIANILYNFLGNLSGNA